ncbi:nitronate monooxygenase [Actibacterium sp. MT2.3-13A]|uniref:NAD(P)H-dependent flavin oxidoreductase n=1 Tax=Actibacterium sp. MT2.3-13A TaxID=2828332 RepID=UPI001BAAD79C|nr:nitronate monooxygenase [Actibacterium sp. MT2.3-13A]
MSPRPADPALETALTRTFGLRLPVIAGGLMWLSDARYVAAGARAGILSFLTAASFPDPDDLRREIARCRDMAAGRPFGVNVSMLPKLVPGERTADVFRLIADAGVRVVETSGRNPEPYLPILKDAGITVIHKVPGVRYALKAQSVGVDMVSIVGAECGGHPGMDLVGSMVNLALAERRLAIPFLIGGGIGAGSQIVAALAAGAAGVVIGTRFLAADEIGAHPDYKSAMVAATERDTALSMASLRNTIRTLRNETTEIVAQLEAGDPDIGIEALMPYVAGAIGRRAYETGDVSRGMLSAGQSLGLLDRAEPLAATIATLEAEAAAALARLRPAPAARKPREDAHP